MDTTQISNLTYISNSPDTSPPIVKGSPDGHASPWVKGSPDGHASPWVKGSPDGHASPWVKSSPAQVMDTPPHGRTCTHLHKGKGSTCSGDGHTSIWVKGSPDGHASSWVKGSPDGHPSTWVTGSPAQVTDMSPHGRTCTHLH